MALPPWLVGRWRPVHVGHLHWINIAHWSEAAAAAEGVSGADAGAAPHPDVASANSAAEWADASGEADTVANAGARQER